MAPSAPATISTASLRLRFLRQSLLPLLVPLGKIAWFADAEIIAAQVHFAHGLFAGPCFAIELAGEERLLSAEVVESRPAFGVAGNPVRGKPRHAAVDGGGDLRGDGADGEEEF